MAKSPAEKQRAYRERLARRVETAPISVTDGNEMTRNAVSPVTVSVTPTVTKSNAAGNVTGAFSAENEGGAGGGVLNSPQIQRDTQSPPVLSTTRDHDTVTEPVTPAESASKLTQPRGLSLNPTAAPKGYLAGDEPIPDETFAGCRIAGYKPEVIREEWAKFIANQAGKGMPVTVAGLCAAFRDGWLPKTRRVLAKAQAVIHEDDLAAIEAQKIRRRESDRLAAQRLEDERAKGPPSPETLRQMAELRSQWEREAPSAPKAPPMRTGLDGWTPPDAAKLAAVRAELEAEIQKAGGRQ